MATQYREYVVAIGDDGQLELPQEVLQLLAVENGEHVRLRVSDEGIVELSKSPRGSIADIAGIGTRSLPTMSKSEQRAIAYEERWQEKQKRSQ